MQPQHRVSKTLVELSQRRALANGTEPAFTFLGADAAASLSFAQLDARARKLAHGLLGRVAPGSRVVILSPPGLDYLTLFFGCLYAGAVAVPLYPPRLKHGADRVNKVMASCDARLITTTDQMVAPLRRYFSDTAAGTELVGIGDLMNAVQEPDALPDPDAEDLAFIQYTSGSTGTPKGVMVRHRNIMANLVALEDVVGCNRADVFVNWLPLFHDLGLITTVMLPVYLGAHSVIMSPASFVQSPRLWLDAISRFRGTICGAPNFAYELCAEKIKPSQLREIDLSTWRVAFNAAEPVDALTLEKFTAIFAEAGFRHAAFYPAYGMAEATVFLAGGTTGQAPIVRDFAKEALQQHRAVDGTGQGQRLVSCGRQAPHHELHIVDPGTCAVLPEGTIGEIWASGPSIAAGYWGQQEASEATFRARMAGDARTFLRTGDLGFILGGQLYVSGRLKDLIIVRGQNYYPQDIESTGARSHAVLEPNAAAAFSLQDGSTERVVLVQEVRASQLKSIDAGEVTAAIGRAIALEFELNTEIVLIRPATLPKTSSGKVQRSLAKAQYLANTLSIVYRAGQAPPAKALVLETLTPLQRELVGTYREVLENDAVTLESDFFALGGDSLAATRLLAAIERTRGVVLGIEELYQAPTVQELASHIADCTANRSNEGTRTILAVQGTRLPLSFAQLRLWLLSQVDSQSTMFNLTTVFALCGELCVVRLNAALRRLVERHDILRTTYYWDAAQAFQRIGPAPPVAITVHDLRCADDRVRRTQALAADSANRQFDLERGPVFNVELLQLHDEHHQLVLTLHHIAVDAWSVGILIDELSQLYADPEATLPRPEVRYADFASWEAGWIAANMPSLGEYWLRQLAEAPALLPLPYDRPRPARQSFAGAVYSVPMSAPLMSRLEAVGRQRQTTVFVVLLSAYQLLLKRLSGVDDIILGTDVANRNHPQLGRVVGFFVNQLVLRSDLSKSLSFDELLCSNRHMMRDALAHQQMPFDKLVERLGVPRDPRYSPVFQVKLLLNPTRFDALQLAGLSVEVVQHQVEYSQYDLTLSFDHDGKTAPAASFHYNTDLFDAQTVADFMSDYLLILEAVAAQPEMSLAAVPCFQTRTESYLRWGRGEHHERAVSLQRRFELQARERAEAIAVVCGAQALTYRELNEAANQLAHFLADIDVDDRTIVGVHLGRSINQVVALLALIKLGAGFLPLDQEYPAQRVEFMLADAGVQFVITDDAEHPHLAGHCGAVVPLDAQRALIAGESKQDLERDSEPGGIAYLLYTSGSSGRPKGTLVANASLLNLCCWYQEFAGITASSSVLHVIPLSFDASIKNILTPLIAGARLVLPASGPFDAAAVNAAIEAQAVNVVNLVPSLFYELLEQARRKDYYALRSLTCVALGGESTDMALLRPWLGSAHCRAGLANLYGPTECTDISVAYWAPHALARDLVTLPIGRPIHNASVYVVNPDMSLAPAGVSGELLIAGSGVGLGYIGEASITDAKFMADPVVAGGRMYRSGDIVHWDRNGQLHYRGRLDEQVKVHGVRIEVSEIEAALATLQGVKRAAVVQCDGHLVGYVATTGLTPPSAAQLKEQLRKCLPRAWIPRAFVLLKELPLLPNGKVDRAHLKGVAPVQQLDERHVEPPTSDVERRLVEIVAAILGLQQVGVDESFFELGGDSMSAVKLVALADDARISLSVADVFELQTIRALARDREFELHSRETDQEGESEAVFDLLSPEDLSVLLATDTASTAPSPQEAYP